MGTTYGQDMDEFINRYIADEDKRIALLELKLIVLKAKRTIMNEIQF
jgi:hypothetical protein